MNRVLLALMLVVVGGAGTSLNAQENDEGLVRMGTITGKDFLEHGPGYQQMRANSMSFLEQLFEYRLDFFQNVCPRIAVIDYENSAAYSTLQVLRDQRKVGEAKTERERLARLRRVKVHLVWAAEWERKANEWKTVVHEPSVDPLDPEVELPSSSGEELQRLILAAEERYNASLVQFIAVKELLETEEYRYGCYIERYRYRSR